jgi:hypothetical protein
MDKVAQFKQDIYESAMEKQALFGINTAIKAFAGNVAKNGLGTAVKQVGTNIAKSGLGTKMAVGAGVGALNGAVRAPRQGEDRGTNMIKGAFGGAATGVALHGATGGFRGGNVAATENAAKSLSSPGMNVNPNNADFVVNSNGTTFSKDQLINVDPNMVKVQSFIDELYMEKKALFGAGAANAVKEVAETVGKEVVKDSTEAAVKKPGLLTKAYNSFAGKPIKNAVVGAGIGGMMTAGKYKPEEDDGTFAKSRFGSLASGMIGGAGAGAATGLALKPIKVASYREMIEQSAMEKMAAANPLAVAGQGVYDAVRDFTKLDEVTRMAIGAGLGSTINVIRAIKEEKSKEDITKKDKLLAIGKAGLEGAAVGSFLGSIAGPKPKK